MFWKKKPKTLRASVSLDVWATRKEGDAPGSTASVGLWAVKPERVGTNSWGGAGGTLIATFHKEDKAVFESLVALTENPDRAYRLRVSSLELELPTEPHKKVPSLNYNSGLEYRGDQ